MGRTELARMMNHLEMMCIGALCPRRGQEGEQQVTGSKRTRNLVFLLFVCFHFAAPDPISELCLMAEPQCRSLRSGVQKPSLRLKAGDKTLEDLASELLVTCVLCTQPC